MLGNIGIPGLILILIIALIIFGPKKLPEMGRAVGQTLKEFKKSTKELTSEFEEDDRKPSKAKTQETVEKVEVVETTTEDKNQVK